MAKSYKEKGNGTQVEIVAEKAKPIFVKGIAFFTPNRDKYPVPDWIKSNVVISLDDLFEFAEQQKEHIRVHETYGDTLKCVLAVNKDGRYSLKLDTYKKDN